MLTIKNKKIIEFYKQNGHFDFEQMNLLIVDFLEKISQNKNANRDDLLLQSFKILESQVSNLNDNIKTSSQNIMNLQTTVSNIPNNLSDNISTNISSIKENSISQISNILENQNHKTNEYFDSKLKNIIVDNFRNILDTSIVELKSSLSQTNSSSNLIENINTSFQSRCDALQNIMLTQFTSMKDLNSSYSETLNNVQNHFDRQKSANYKGIDSENNVEQGLNDSFPDAIIINTTGTPRSGDFWIERSGKDKIMLENKFHSANVSIPDIEKFIRDAEYQNCHGILISQKSGIARKKNFQIDIHNGFIMVFIHNINYDFDKVKLAIDAIDHLSNTLKNSNMDSNDFKISNEIIKEINNEYQKFIVQRNSLTETLKLFNRDMTKQISQLEFPELSKLLTQQFTSTEASVFKCEYCKFKVYKNAKALAKHVQTCKNKNHTEDICIEIEEQ